MEYQKKKFVMFMMGLVLIPAISMLTPVVNLKKFSLAETIEFVEFEPFTLKSWLNGSFQRTFTGWFADHLAFREILIRASNQVDVSVFDEARFQTGHRLTLGKEGWIYETTYVEDFNHRNIISDEFLHQEAVKLKKVQDRLAERGIAMLFLISPSKAVVYQEFLPERFIDKNRNDRKSNRERIVPMLRQLKVNYFDATEGMLSHRAIKNFPLMPKGGTHWNEYAACEMMRLAFQKIKEDSGKDFTQIDCGDVHLNYEPTREDSDLWIGLNIFTTNLIRDLVPHSQVKPVRSPNSVNPKIFAIGDSFLRLIFTVFDQSGVYCQRDYDYYHKQRNVWNDPKLCSGTTTANKTSIWDNDIVLFEVTELFLARIGFGFLDEFLEEPPL